MDLWRRNKRSSRLATPFLKTADVLLGSAAHPVVSQHAGRLFHQITVTDGLAKRERWAFVFRAEADYWIVGVMGVMASSSK